jgi:hypothetical protein
MISFLAQRREVTNEMSKKELATLIGWALVALHALAILKDAERYGQNLARFSASPTVPNFVKLAVAEGVLIGDLG